MKIKCKNCGTSSDYRCCETVSTENTIIKITKCMCGRLKQQSIYNKVRVEEYEDNSLKNIKNT